MAFLSITSYGGRPELGLLAIAIVLGIVHLVWASVEARRQQGLKWARGPRDEPAPITERDDRGRARSNYNSGSSRGHPRPRVSARASPR